MKQLSLIIFIFLVSIGCSNKELFENNRGSCKLQLGQDSSYKFKYPTFLGHRSEIGKFKILNNSILLSRIQKNNFDSADYSTTYFSKDPDTVAFSFKNLNENNIYVKFTINDSKNIHQTDTLGHLNLSYSDLILNKEITSDSVFYSFNIYFGNKNYTIKDNIIKPTDIDVNLNQYIGKKEVVL